MSIRMPVAAGRFYPADKESLQKQLNSFLIDTATPRPAVAAMMPHAGYMYSGLTAGIVASSIEITDTVIMLGPKHTRIGLPAAVSPDDYWRTPLGDVPVNKSMSLEFTECSLLQFDEGAHFQEHSLEVLLPFLQVQNPDLQIVPVALALNSLSRIETVAAHIAAVAERAGKRPLILVSSDMSHYVDSRVAERLDNMAIEEMIKVDGSGLFNTVHKEGISMCGVLPAAVALKAAKIMGASYGELLDYTHSGQVSNDDSSVVGYAGVALF